MLIQKKLSNHKGLLNDIISTVHFLISLSVLLYSFSYKHYNYLALSSIYLLISIVLLLLSVFQKKSLSRILNSFLIPLFYLSVIFFTIEYFKENLDLNYYVGFKIVFLFCVSVPLVLFDIHIEKIYFWFSLLFCSAIFIASDFLLQYMGIDLSILKNTYSFILFELLSNSLFLLLLFIAFSYQTFLTKTIKEYGHNYRELNAIKNETQMQTKKVSRLQDDLNEVNNRRYAQNEEISDLKNTIESLEEKLAEEEQQKQELGDNHEKIKEKLKHIKLQLEDSEKNIFHLKKEKEDLLKYEKNIEKQTVRENEDTLESTKIRSKHLSYTLKHFIRNSKILIENTLQSEENEEKNTFVKTLHKQIQITVLSLIRVSRLLNNESEEEMDMQEVNIKDLCQSIKNTEAAVLQSKGVNIKIENKKENTIYTDRVLLYQALSQLVAIVIDYSSNKKAKTIQIEEQKKSVIFKIVDMYENVSEESLPVYTLENMEKSHLSIPFFDLTMIDFIVSLLHGKFYFKTKEKAGSIFYIELSHK